MRQLDAMLAEEARVRRWIAIGQAVDRAQVTPRGDVGLDSRWCWNSRTLLALLREIGSQA